MSGTWIATRRTNDDPREDTWEWVLYVNHRPAAVSWNNYTSSRGARLAARRVRDAIKVGLVHYPDADA